MGERDVFPHCGSNTRIRLEGARDGVYPVVTGTFGGVDFLHSVTGEGKPLLLYQTAYFYANILQSPTS